jgi:hypothetical protein
MRGWRQIGIHEQHVDIAVAIQVSEPSHVAIDDGQLGVRCCPGGGPRVEVPIVGRPRLDLLRRVVGPSRLAYGSEEDHRRGLGVAGRVRPQFHTAMLMPRGTSSERVGRFASGTLSGTFSAVRLA